MVNTGTNVIIAPKSAADAIFAAIPGSKSGGSRFGNDSYLYPCDTAVEYMPTFIISGAPLTLASEDFNYGPIDDTTCISNVFGREDLWRFGAPFMTSFYTVLTWGESTTGEEVGAGAAVSFATGIQDYCSGGPCK